jgi:hypothetical protein
MSGVGREKDQPRLTVRMNSVGSTGSSTSWFITTARISERNMSVIEKHTPIAVYARQCAAHMFPNHAHALLTIYRSLQADFLFGLVQKHHEFGRGEKFALPHARQVGADAAEPLGRGGNDGAEDGLDQVLGLGLPVEDRHNAGQMP